MAILSRFEGSKSVPQNDNEGNDVRMYHRLIILTYGFTPVINCLSVTTAYWWLMKRKGITTSLKFGMRTEHGKLLAHAWLEYKGNPLTENKETEEKYTPFMGSIL